jgi:hypothetical protein
MTNSADEPVEDWEDLLPKLIAFTRKYTSDRNWFRGGDTANFLAGKQVEDYVYEAITRYLEDKSKYKRNKGSLTAYLKLNVIRSMVANDLRKSENKLTDDVFGSFFSGGEDEINDLSYEDIILPYTEPLFVDDADYHNVKDYIKEQIKGDTIAENVFLGYEYSLKRREIIEEFEMSDSEYDNGFRRLKTALSNASYFFNPNKSKV